MNFEQMRDELRRGGVEVVSVPQLFPTPRELALRMAKLADVQPGHRVLEPSAGTGVLLSAIGARYTCGSSSGEPCAICDEMYDHRPVAVELNRGLANRLGELYRHVQVWEADFLSLTVEELGRFDRAVMNPPFAKGADIQHILHARQLLHPDGLLVAICAGGPRQARALRPSSTTWEELPRGTFEGTRVGSVLLTMGAEVKP